MGNEADRSGKLCCKVRHDRCNMFWKKRALRHWGSTRPRQAKLQDGGREVDIERMSDERTGFARALRAAK